MQKENTSINKITSDIVIEFDDEKMCEAVYQGLVIEKSDYKRSKLKITKLKNNRIKIKIIALDKTAFFASNNGIMTMLRALL
ncbi:MAG: hypothetical protein N3E37_03740 [Candidatus Micrarchaeota archaeon]|nr:hypothetical protein [Candidatus Micrarchaeota archaeon]